MLTNNVPSQNLQSYLLFTINPNSTKFGVGLLPVNLYYGEEKSVLLGEELHGKTILQSNLDMELSAFADSVLKNPKVCDFIKKNF